MSKFVIKVGYFKKNNQIRATIYTNIKSYSSRVQNNDHEKENTIIPFSFVYKHVSVGTDYRNKYPNCITIGSKCVNGVWSNSIKHFFEWCAF